MEFFFQKMFTYKINLFNNMKHLGKEQESVKKKFKINRLVKRQKVVSKNLKYGFWSLIKKKY